LADWVSELAMPIYYEREVTGFAQDDTGVDVELGGGPSVRAKYLVGCDGGRSLIGKKAAVSAPTAVLIRPDGHVAWTGGGLTTWFGPPTLLYLAFRAAKVSSVVLSGLGTEFAPTAATDRNERSPSK
jgi:2-polyprenyl-6-methoxyphenol hydroxylase-like FAD-dependent oxidoreductase